MFLPLQNLNKTVKRMCDECEHERRSKQALEVELAAATDRERRLQVGGDFCNASPCLALYARASCRLASCPYPVLCVLQDDLQTLRQSVLTRGQSSHLLSSA